MISRLTPREREVLQALAAGLSDREIGNLLLVSTETVRTHMVNLLHKLEVEDPCLWIERHPTTHETVMRGLGDLHMRTKLEKMQQQYKMDVATKPPKIPYRETVTKRAEGHCRHKKQTGGAGQFGEVFLKIEPLPRGSGFQFASEVKGGVIPTVFIPAVEKGVRQALDHGVVAGYPVEDLKVIVYDGKSHDVDSKEIAFVTAGRKAVIDAILKASPIMLEPIVNIEITAPDRFVGDLTSDLSSKRGQVTGTESTGGDLMSILGIVPLSEVAEYQSRLRSVTGGQGAYTVEFSHYAAVPPITQQQHERSIRCTEQRGRVAVHLLVGGLAEIVAIAAVILGGELGHQRFSQRILG
jgi:elongation factor G